MADVAARLSTRVQLTTDGHNVYLEAVEGAFGSAIGGNCALHDVLQLIHKSLRVTPAMEAGKADHVWSLEEIVALAD